MNLLAIDTSTELATIAVTANGELYSEEQGSMRQHAQFLLPMVERLLAVAGLSVSQLDGIIFGCGPGSFTGLRIACSVAKGLAYAHDLPVFPVSSLAAIAHGVAQEEGGSTDTPILAMIDARMDQVYWGYFSGQSFSVQEQVTSAADMILGSTKPLIVAGVGFESYLPLLPEAIRALIIKQRIIFPQASAMIRLVQLGHITAVSAAEALPVYVRNQVTHGAAKEN